MACRSCLNDPTAVVVADASVVINLIATRFAGTILDCLPNRFSVIEEVAVEIDAGRRNGRLGADGLDALVAAGHIDIVHLGNPGIGYFSELVSGSAADTLDDGEAATIAYALERCAEVLIDERKANKICTERFGALVTGCSVDLLANDTVEAGLGRTGQAEAVFNALYYGRMRVPTHYVDWVINLIGRERTKRCVSLPKSIRRR